MDIDTSKGDRCLLPVFRGNCLVAPATSISNKILIVSKYGPNCTNGEKLYRFITKRVVDVLCFCFHAIIRNVFTDE